MKQPIFLITLLLLISCRKDGEYGLGVVTGKTDDMIITEHDTIITAEFETGYNEVWYKMDLDDDGSNDLSFVSYENEILYPDSSMYYRVWVHIYNDQLSVIEVPQSGKQFEEITIGYDYYGTFPRKTYYHIITCDSLANTHLYDQSDRNSAFCFNKDVLLGNHLDWNNEYPEVDLIRGEFIQSSYDFNQSGDSLIGHSFNKEGACVSAPLDEYFYLAFKTTIGSQDRYGWVELKITDHNSLHLSRSAITPN